MILMFGFLSWGLIFIVTIIWVFVLAFSVTQIIPFMLGLQDEGDWFYKFMNRGLKKGKIIFLSIFMVFGLYMVGLFIGSRLIMRENTTTLTTNDDISKLLREKPVNTLNEVEYDLTPAEYEGIIDNLVDDLIECEGLSN